MPVYVSVIPMIIVGIVFIVSFLGAVAPRFLWKIFESWKATEEPSKAFFLMRRIGGIIGMAILIMFFLSVYLMGRR